MAAVLDWFAAGGRDLPWRRTRDPWAVLVAELMLQQTGVDRVVPRYLAFLADLPTPAACAAVPVGEVVARWQGLGYNRRAVNLHRCAVAVVEEHGGVLPASLGALLALPGVGPYTARAVLAFAFEAPVGVLDVNVTRVLSRLLGRPATQADADALVPGRSAVTQAGAGAGAGADVRLPGRPADGPGDGSVAGVDLPAGAGAPSPGSSLRPRPAEASGGGPVADGGGTSGGGPVPASAPGWSRGGGPAGRGTSRGASVPASGEVSGGGPAAWAWNQAVMELGATVCRPRPACTVCPAAATCAWRGEGPDPWVRPARQSRFEGSDRQGRGRLVDALRRGPVPDADLPTVMGWPDDPRRAHRVAATLVPDGLARRAPDGLWHLP